MKHTTFIGWLADTTPENWGFSAKGIVQLQETVISVPRAKGNLEKSGVIARSHHNIHNFC